MDFQMEVLGECLEEMKPLLKEHYKEVAMYQDHIDLNPKYDLYQKMELGGYLSVFTARDQGRLVGYAIFFIDTHMHYQDHAYAVNDVLYIDPEYRHEGRAVSFLDWIEKQLEKEVSVITYHMKIYKPFQSLMKYLQYDHAEHIYTKYVRKD